MSIKQGNQLFAKGMYREAIEEYRKIRNEDPIYKHAQLNISFARKKIEYDIRCKEELIIESASRIVPIISIIVPVYNSEKYLDECIKSIREQTFKDIELILIDDGSTDRSWEIMENHRSQDNRLIIIQQNNKSAGAARNNGLSKMKGEYVLFIDSDDFIHPELLEKTYKKAIDSKSEIILFNAKEFDDKIKKFRDCDFVLDKSLIPEESVFNYLDIKDKIFQSIASNPWNKLFKRELIDRSGIKFQEIRNANDLLFVYSLLVEANSISFLDEALVCYRINNPKSLQRTKSDSWECIFLAFYALKIRLEYIGCFTSVENSFINKFFRSVFYYMRSVDSKTRKIMECAFANKYYSLFDINSTAITSLYSNEHIEYLSKIVNRTYVPVVYACDRNYLPHTYVSITSLIENLSENTHVVIYIMHDQSITEDDIKLFHKLNNESVVVEFINMKDSFSNMKMKISHISYVTYFRLEIPRKLGFYDKVLYLDSDTIINSDISKIFNINIDEYYVAGVKALSYHHKRTQDRLKIDPSNYINAGVLLLNNKKIISKKIYERFFSLLGRGYSSQDQDIINVAFNGKIRILDKRFNFMTKYVRTQELQEYQEIDILHFADKVKPWNDITAIYADFFWKYAKKTPFYRELLEKLNVKNDKERAALFAIGENRKHSLASRNQANKGIHGGTSCQF